MSPSSIETINTPTNARRVSDPGAPNGVRSTSNQIVRTMNTRKIAAGTADTARNRRQDCAVQCGFRRR